MPELFLFSMGLLAGIISTLAWWEAETKRKRRTSFDKLMKAIHDCPMPTFDTQDMKAIRDCPLVLGEDDRFDDPLETIEPIPDPGSHPILLPELTKQISPHNAIAERVRRKVLA